MLVLLVCGQSSTSTLVLVAVHSSCCWKGFENLLHESLIYCAVDGGHRAVIFDRFRGVQDQVSGEGTHFLIPWVQRPIIFDCRARPRNVPVVTGSKGKVKKSKGKTQVRKLCMSFSVN